MKSRLVPSNKCATLWMLPPSKRKQTTVANSKKRFSENKVMVGYVRDGKYVLDAVSFSSSSSFRPWGIAQSCSSPSIFASRERASTWRVIATQSPWFTRRCLPLFFFFSFFFTNLSYDLFRYYTNSRDSASDKLPYTFLIASGKI